MSGYVQVPVINQEETFNKQNGYAKHYQIYKLRWFMLYLEIMCAMCMAMQFMQFTIISNITVEFYGVSYEAIDWSGMLFLLLYIPLVFPTMYVMNKISIRASLLLSMTGACAAAWIKVGAVAPDRYWVALLGQVVVSSFQVFVVVLPARFAAVWFGKNQVALACGLGVFGVQLGLAVGSVIPTMVVKPGNQASVVYDMYAVNIGYAVMCTTFLILIFAFFKSEPPTPPSHAQKQLEEMTRLQLVESTKHLFTNYSYVLLTISTGIGMGIFNSLPTLLNQIISQYYQNASEDTGRIGLLMLVVGMLGVTVSGYVLDKFERYNMVAFTLALHYSMAAVYISSIVLGFFMTATSSVCLEVAAELTYPIPETTSSGYLIASSQVFGIALTHSYSFIMYRFGVFWANGLICLTLLISTILIICMKFELKRRTAEDPVTKRSVERTL